jgi:hypothetical protein
VDLDLYAGQVDTGGMGGAVLGEGSVSSVPPDPPPHNIQHLACESQTFAEKQTVSVQVMPD